MARVTELAVSKLFDLDAKPSIHPTIRLSVR